MVPVLTEHAIEVEVAMLDLGDLALRATDAVRQLLLNQSRRFAQSRSR